MIEVSLHYYGPLRELGRESLSLNDGARVADARRQLMQRHPTRSALLRVCAFGNDSEVLRDDAELRSGSYSVLPPVSGG